MSLWYKFKYNPDVYESRFFESTSDASWTEIDQKESLVNLKRQNLVQQDSLFQSVQVMKYGHGGKMRLWIVAKINIEDTLMGWMIPYTIQCNELLKHLAKHPNEFEDAFNSNKFSNYKPKVKFDWEGLDFSSDLLERKSPKISGAEDLKSLYLENARPCEIQDILNWDDSREHRNFWINVRLDQGKARGGVSFLQNDEHELGSISSTSTKPVDLDLGYLNDPMENSISLATKPNLPIHQSWLYYSRSEYQDYGVMSSGGPKKVIDEAMNLLRKRFLDHESLKILQEAQPRLAIFEMEHGGGFFISRTSPILKDMHGRKIREYLFLPVTEGLLNALYDRLVQPNSLSNINCQYINPYNIQKIFECVAIWRNSGMIGCPPMDWASSYCWPKEGFSNLLPTMDYPKHEDVPPWIKDLPLSYFRVGFVQAKEEIIWNDVQTPAHIEVSELCKDDEPIEDEGAKNLEDLKKLIKATNLG